MTKALSSATTRRRFLGAAAGVTGALAVSAIEPGRANAAVLPPDGSIATAAQSRPFTRGNVALELAGAQQALLKSGDGGDTVGEVATFRSGSDPVAKKQIGNVKYEGFALFSNFEVGLPYAQWIVDMPNFQGTRKDGAVVVADFQFAVKSRREFKRALIGGITVPTLDASSKDAGYFTIAVTPESASDGSPKGTVTPTAPQGAAQRVWQVRNFRLEIDGLDCTKVAKIESFTIKQQILEFRSGESRDVVILPGTVDFPNLAITFAASTLASWQQWFNSFVVKGNNSDSEEKSGRIVFLQPDLKTELGVLQLHHMGIYHLDPELEPDIAGALPTEAMSRARAELYVEQMNFTKFGPYALT
jgi:hypothetical protein